MLTTKNFLNKDLANFKEGNDILLRMSVVSGIKAKNPNIIDVTGGTLTNEEGKLYVLPVVRDEYYALKDPQIFAYSATQGPKEFGPAITKLLFGDYEKAMAKKISWAVLPMVGGCGGIFETINACSNYGDQIVYHNPCWNVYSTSVELAGRKSKTFPLIKNNRFNLKGMLKAIDATKNPSKHVCILLNDPCNNPASVSLSIAEFDELIKELNARQDKTFTLFLDIAYYEFGDGTFQEKFSHLTKLLPNTMVVIGWSASKSFTMYGNRLGAAIFIHKDKKLIAEVADRARMRARATWSNCPNNAINMIINIVNDEKKYQRYRKDLQDAKDYLFEKMKIFDEEAKKVGLEYLPYQGGFFLSIITKKSTEVIKNLEKYNVYAIDFNGFVRFALASVKKDIIKKLPAIIKKSLVD